MLASRRDRLQAILLGLIMADAVDHRQLAWPLPLATPQNIANAAPETSLTPAISTDACRCLSQILSLGVEHPSGPVPAPPAPADLSLVEALMVGLPWLLPISDRLTGTDVATIPGLQSAEPAEQAEILRMSQAFARLMEADWAGAIALFPHQPGDSAMSAVTVFAPAWEAVELARGDFLLAVGQGLHTASPMAGLPLVCALLSAAWGGYRGLPSRVVQQLMTPSPALQDWLTDRWQIANAQCVEAWAHWLWQRWMGQYAPFRHSPAVPLHPAIATVR